jgi:hypothetical protein
MAQSADGGTSGGVPEFTIPGVTAHDPGTKGAAGRRRAAAEKNIAIIFRQLAVQVVVEFM